jgi:hypothetical protein
MSPVEHKVLNRFVWADVLLGLAIPPELTKSVCELVTKLHNEFSSEQRRVFAGSCPADSGKTTLRGGHMSIATPIAVRHDHQRGFQPFGR